MMGGSTRRVERAAGPPPMRTPSVPSLRAVALALSCALVACSGEDAAASTDTAAEEGGSSDAPVGAAIDSAPAIQEVPYEPVPGDPPDPETESTDASTSDATSSLAEVYAEPSATGSTSERDQLAAAALGDEVLEMRKAAQERAKELAEASADSEYPFVDFEHFVFEDYTPPEFREDKRLLTPEDFPEDIRAWNGKKVQLAGFMIAVDFKDKKIEDFMLCRFPPGCCFGGVPLFDEWVDCTPAYDEKRDWSPYEMILVEGTLEVGEVVDEDGFALSIYRLRVDDVRPFE